MYWEACAVSVRRNHFHHLGHQHCSHSSSFDVERYLLRLYMIIISKDDLNAFYRRWRGKGILFIGDEPSEKAAFNFGEYFSVDSCAVESSNGL